MPTETEVAIAETHMKRIVGDLEQLERRKQDLQIEYWGWQAFRYPLNECHHDSAHFCANCGNNS